MSDKKPTRFEDEYILNTRDALLKIDPSLNKEKVEKELMHLYRERLKDPTIIMDNNVTMENHTITLTRMCQWINKRNPVVSGNATFYCQPSEKVAATANFLRTLKKERKSVKKEMFSYKPGSDEYQMLDLDQGNIKVIMNADYGASGTKTAAFYTKYSPAATTLMAQSIITTMAAFFEGYIGDNQKFYHINECFDWMNRVLKKEEEIPDWIVVPSAMDVASRIKRHFILLSPNDSKILDQYMSNRSKKELVYLYYANNFKALIQNHPKILKLVEKVLLTLPNHEAAVDDVPDDMKTQFPAESGGGHIEKYNKWMSKVMFLDPYNIPESIKKYMDQFIKYMTQFVYVEYLTPDSIVKLNLHKRNTVLLVDTDSNIINSDIFVSFILDEMLPNITFGRKRLYNDMILVNVLAASIDESVRRILDYYGRCHNMDEESRAELTMKNEFMFRKLFLMKTKKRYAASIVLREGNIIIPFKPEIKGVDFIKAGLSQDVEKRFTNMLQNYILFSDGIEMHALVEELKQFEMDIFNDLKKGGLKYLKQMQLKSADGYKDAMKAWSLPVFRGSMVWNEIYPDREIYSLDRVRILKTIVKDMNDVERIKEKYPKMYATVYEKIFNSNIPEIKKAGLKYIAIPNNLKVMPEWLIPLIDFDITISDIMSSFKSIQERLRINTIDFNTPNGKASKVSCLVSL